MKLPRICLFLVLPGIAFGASGESAPRVQLDAKEFIRSSSNLLQDREPEMTPTEFAIYEQVVPMAKGQPEFALRLLEGMADEAATSAAFDLVLGNVYFELERFPEAEARYRRAIEKHPEFRRAWENLGVLYYSTDRPAQAVPCFSKVITLGGWEAYTLGLLGASLALSGNPMAAELAYTQAYVIEPENAEWIEGLLHVVMESRQFARAETLLRQLTRQHPREARHWEALANVILAQKRPLDAIPPLEIASQLGALTTEGLQLLGDLYADAGFADEAVRSYRQLAERDVRMGTERLLRYARALSATGDHATAAALLEPLAGSLSPEDRAPYLEARIALHTARGETPAARQQLEALLALQPMNGRALIRLAEIQQAQNDDARAAFTLEAAARIPEFAFAAHVQLAQLHVKSREYSQALARLESALAIEDSPILRNYHTQVASLITPDETL